MEEGPDQVTEESVISEAAAVPKHKLTLISAFLSPEHVINLTLPPC